MTSSLNSLISLISLSPRLLRVEQVLFAEGFEVGEV